MHYTQKYKSPLGNILLAADEEGLTGLWFEGQKYFASNLAPEHQEKDTPIFEQVFKWLNIYFSGENPNFTPPLHMLGTEFQIKVWEHLLKISYGQTITYGQLARLCGITSAQAVGGAVGHNAISIIIPCHRVVGANGNLTGYSAGIDKKLKLLSLEKINTEKFFVPNK